MGARTRYAILNRGISETLVPQSGELVFKMRVINRFSRKIAFAMGTYLYQHRITIRIQQFPVIWQITFPTNSLIHNNMGYIITRSIFQQIKVRCFVIKTGIKIFWIQLPNKIKTKWNQKVLYPKTLLKLFILNKKKFMMCRYH